jgi:hypothetical protein
MIFDWEKEKAKWAMEKDQLQEKKRIDQEEIDRL